MALNEIRENAAIEAEAAAVWGRRNLLLLLAIALGAVVVRIAWIWHVNVDPLAGHNDDTVFYYATARSLAEHFSYRDQFDRLTAAWPPEAPRRQHKNRQNGRCRMDLQPFTQIEISTIMHHARHRACRTGPNRPPRRNPYPWLEFGHGPS